jgi:excisionase family DNA binding protein
MPRAQQKAEETDAPLTVTVKRAQALSGLSHSTIYMLIADGTLKSTTIGTRRLIVYSSLVNMLTPRPVRS